MGFNFSAYFFVYHYNRRGEKTNTKPNKKSRQSAGLYGIDDFLKLIYDFISISLK